MGPPDGVLCRGQEQGFCAEIDLAKLRAYREEGISPMLKDRRPELYRRLLYTGAEDGPLRRPASTPTVRGKEEWAFPCPSRLLGLDRFPGLSERKVGYLRALAHAALEGRLEASYLRSLTAEDALAGLKELPGIGDFSAELVLLRGASVPDRLPIHEPRLARAVAMAYNLGETPTAEELAEISEGWRPYRTWVALHLRTMLEDKTGEIAGRSKSSRSEKFGPASA